MGTATKKVARRTSKSGDELPHPDYSGDPPKSILKSRRIEGINPLAEGTPVYPDTREGRAREAADKEARMVRYLPGEGSGEVPVMFVSTALFPSEWEGEEDMGFGAVMEVKPAMLRGGPGSILSDTCNSVGMTLSDCYYTALCKWPMPKALRAAPKKPQLRWAMPAFMEEVARVKPQIIVCFNKPVFDFLMGKQKINYRDAICGWFYSELTQCEVFLAHDLHKAPYRAEIVTLLHTDLVEVRRRLDGWKPASIPSFEERYETISDSDQLRELVARLAADNRTLLSVDCEWHGQTHIDGRLRSLQICWAPGEAAYIRFTAPVEDAEGVMESQYVFDVGYDKAGEILGAWLDRPEVKYVGHHLPADLPWMHHVLGLEWYDKGFLDTEFSLQCCDEYEELALERLALKFTDLGRYDHELVMWKRDNGPLVKGGYGMIPDEILIPYGCKDVDTVMRTVPFIMSDMRRQGLTDYYFDVLHPMVYNVFCSFAIRGLPMDEVRMEELRDLMNFAYDRLLIMFRDELVIESVSLLAQALIKHQGNAHYDPWEVAQGVSDRVSEKYWCGADETPKDPLELFPVDGFRDPDHPVYLAYEHMLDAPDFNLRSWKHMRRWLFDVKGYHPLKSTSNREAGRPSIPWEKVKELPPSQQKAYLAAYDVQTLEILRVKHEDNMLDHLLNLNKIGNIVKAMIPDPVRDENNKVIEEKGQLYSYLCSDGRIHGQMSTTETGRPRSWNPNTLNWPAYMDKRISVGVTTALTHADQRDELPARFKRYLEGEKVPSVRSCVCAPEGWCMVESDYATAEIRGLAFISGDEKLIKIMTEPDPQFVLTRDGRSTRVCYHPDCGIPRDAQDRSFIFAKVENNEIVGYYGPEDIVLNEAGDPSRPSVDLHWSLAEMTNRKPREMMVKADRDAAKVGNFSSAYGASPATIERKIEQDTGKKPTEGFGDEILDALERRQTVAVGFLESMENVPEHPGQYQAASGRIRHFARHPQNISISSRDKKEALSSMGREARNFPMQESVAATAARASANLLRQYRSEDLHGYPMIVLYDAVVTLCPLHERERVAELHQEFMTDKNNWTYHGREMNYPIDTDYNQRWSTAPTPAETEILGKPGHTTDL